MAEPKHPRARGAVQVCVLAACLTGLAAIAACRGPTEITIVLSTDVKCADVKGTALTVGALVNLDDKPATTVTAACDPQTGRIGSMVIVPSGSKDDTVAIKAVLGVGKDPAECVPPAYGPGCIVARRALHFIPSSSLTVPIFLATACGGIPCNATETCVGGNCTSATIDDSSKCEDPTGCGESALGPTTFDAGGGGGGDAADAAVVSPRVDAAVPDAATADAADASKPGVVSITQAVGAASVDVSAEGTVDWMHWGFNGVRFDRKLGGTAIQNYTPVGTVTSTDWFNNDPTSFSWTGGDPTPSATTPTHVHMRGTAMGFSVSIDASPTMRTATFYVGGYMTHGRLTATLSDGSAPPVSADAQNFTSANGYSERFDVPFSSSTPGAKLIATWVLAEACVADCTMRLSTVTLH